MKSLNKNFKVMWNSKVYAHKIKLLELKEKRNEEKEEERKMIKAN